MDQNLHSYLRELSFSRTQISVGAILQDHGRCFAFPKYNRNNQKEIYNHQRMIYAKYEKCSEIQTA